MNFNWRWGWAVRPCEWVSGWGRAGGLAGWPALNRGPPCPVMADRGVGRCPSCSPDGVRWGDNAGPSQRRSDKRPVSRRMIVPARAERSQRPDIRETMHSALNL